MCRMSWKSGSLNLLEPSGPHRACYGTALSLTFYLGTYPRKLRWFSAIDVCLQFRYHQQYCTMLCIPCNYFSICIVTLLLHIYDITSHYGIISSLNISLNMAEKKVETCGRTTKCLYITECNYSPGAELPMWLVLLHGTWMILKYLGKFHIWSAKLSQFTDLKF